MSNNNGFVRHVSHPPVGRSEDARAAPRCFRKRPVVIEAVQYTERVSRVGWGHDVPEWLDAAYEEGVLTNVADGIGGEAGWKNPRLLVKTLEGKMTALPGDWIIRGVAGEIYPCKPDIFEQTYEPVDAQATSPAPQTADRFRAEPQPHNPEGGGA